MSATTSPAALPTPEPDDPSDVTVAIEAAGALWENGDREEALRWFSRAAEAAEQAGNDRRSLELARAVADLKDSLAAPPAASAATAPKPEPPAAPALPTAPAAAPPSPPAASTSPKLVTRPPPPPSARKSIAPTPPSMRPRPPEATTAKSFTGPPVPEATNKPEPAPAAVTAPAAKSVPAETRNDGVKGERLRVSVKSSVRDPNLLLVRILGAGQSVPAGSHEAFLSPAQSGIDLRSPGE
jgi:hypothetical protein